MPTQSHYPVPLHERRTLRINEITGYYGPSRSAVYNDIRAGRLRKVKVGKSSFVTRESCDALYAGKVE